MEDDVLAEQRDLIERIEAAGWDVTAAEVSVYQSPWEDDQAPEATVTLTARKRFSDEEDDRSPYRVR